ncbi:MAG TPA: class I SAM-dependent methyltransferase [Blastocatellia bacterium]|nr:class I SAM-dependent methyltransferase [Blastocatellia bacterium]
MASPELFDSQAEAFDRRAGLPEAVCQEIARKVLEIAAVGAGELVAEIGAGTGQIGQWIGGPVRYVGFDLSGGMLQEFAQRILASAADRVLVQADANSAWPVADGAARAIFGSRVLHLLDAEHVAAEAARVASPAGATLFIGRVERQADSVRARMAREMNERLRRRGLEPRRGEQRDRRLIEACCRRGARPLPEVAVATWHTSSSPRQSLASWRSLEKLGGHPLAPALRDEVLAELEAWAEDTFGGLDEPVQSAEAYVLKALRLSSQGGR